MRSVITWLDRHQVALYLIALAAGAVIGVGAPAVARPAELAITPVLALLLTVTFLAVPFAKLAAALRDLRFLLTVLAVNFAIVPLVVFLITRPIAGDRVLLVGALFVLLAPCIDYVIVFTGLAGGAADRLLAAAPVLMLVQLAALPLFLWLFAGEELGAAAVDLTPFAEAFVTLIALPLVVAGLLQFAAARTAWGRRIEAILLALMVPLMMLTLAVVVASQVAGIGAELASLARVIPIYLLFAVALAIISAFVGRTARLDVPATRALVFSGVTRNSLVVLPLVLALPQGFELAPLVVVTQTLVELLVMVAGVKLVPFLVPDRGPAERSA